MNGKPKLRLIHNLARVGGTLICKCIGCMDEVMLLSEIHPLGVDLYNQLFNPVRQTHQWYNLYTPEDIVKFKGQGTISFHEVVMLIDTRARERGQKLVIRDWAHLDYMAVPFIEKPTGQLMLATILREHFELLQFSIVRHPIDQLLSVVRHRLLNEKLTLDIFLHGCAAFAEQAVKTGFVRFEDFTANPVDQIALVCGKLEFAYDAGWIERWSTYTHITGDTGNSSRGNVIGYIKCMPRRDIDGDLLKSIRQHPAYHRTLELLGYEDA